MWLERRIQLPRLRKIFHQTGFLRSISWNLNKNTTKFVTQQNNLCLTPFKQQQQQLAFQTICYCWWFNSILIFFVNFFWTLTWQVITSVLLCARNVIVYIKMHLKISSKLVRKFRNKKQQELCISVQPENFCWGSSRGVPKSCNGTTSSKHWAFIQCSLKEQLYRLLP